MSVQRSVSAVLACFVLFHVIGCGGAPPRPVEALVPAGGTIELDGKPAAGVQIRLMPFGGDGSAKSIGTSYATTGEDGKFKVIHWSNKEGISPGAYLITFSKMVKPDGSPVPPNESPAMVNAKESIAPVWSSLEVEGHLRQARRVEIPAAGKTDIKFSITSAPTS